MTNKEIPLEDWRRLYALAMQVKELAPWQWMYEDMLFAVQDPESGQLGYVSIMGALGEHLSVAVYLGGNGLAGFRVMQKAGEQMSPELFLMTPQLQASFEDRKELHKQDLDIIKALGLKFRGRQAWPQFRSYRPGFLPWFLEAEELVFLTHALEQVLEVTPRIKDNPAISFSVDGPRYLTRVPVRRNGGYVWQDQYLVPPEAKESVIDMTMDVNLLESVKRLRPNVKTVQIDLSLIPGGFKGEKDQRPYFGFSLFLVEAKSGMILGTEILNADPSLEAMWGSIPMRVVKTFASNGVRPGEIHVSSRLLHDLLGPLAEELGLKLRLARRLPALEQARASLMSFLYR